MTDNEVNSKGNKRGMSKESRSNLINMKDRTHAERREYGVKGANKTNEIKKQKVERAEAREYLWNELYSKGRIQDILENGSTKEIIDLVKALLPPEKQTQEIIGNLTTQRIFITPQEKQDTDEHINKTIEGK